MSINWSVVSPKYEIYVIKISVSQISRKLIFLNFPQGLKVFPNLFLCVYKNNNKQTIVNPDFINKMEYKSNIICISREKLLFRCTGPNQFRNISGMTRPCRTRINDLLIKHNNIFYGFYAR